MVTASAARTPLPASTRLDSSTERGAQPAIVSHGTMENGAVWTARLQVDLDAPRPTPRIHSFTIALDLPALRATLDERTSLFAHPEGLAVAHAHAGYLHCGHLVWELAPTGDWQLALQPFLSMVRQAHALTTAHDVHARMVRAISPQLSALHPTTSAQWRWDMAAIFGHFLDVGWNLPVIDAVGSAHFYAPFSQHTDPSSELPDAPWDDRASSHDLAFEGAELLLRWTREPDDTRMTSGGIAPPPLDDRLERALRDAKEGQPISAALWSATAFGDDVGAHLAMELAAHAARQGDHDTLRTLRITQTRLVERGRTRIGTLAALLTAHLSLQDTKSTAEIERLLTKRLAQVFGVASADSWFRSLYEAWRASSASVPLQKPPSDQQSSLVGMPNTAQTFSSSSRGMGEAPAQSAKLPPSKPPSDPTLLPRALDAFEQDEDERAWGLIAMALEQRAPIASEAEASMILRLSTKFADPATHTSALRAIVRDAPSSQHVVRAAQLLAEHEDAAGAFERALETLRAALDAYPDAILLRVARAQLLSRNGHPNAADAWNDVLAQPNLEAWEIAQYRQERDAAIAWNAEMAASSKAPDENESATPTADEALDALYHLCFGTTRRAESIPRMLVLIDRALSKRPAAPHRASLLAQRAMLYLLEQTYDRAAQSWTGALILTPEDPKVLAGVALTRTLQGTAPDAQPARQRFLESMHAHSVENPVSRDALSTLHAFLGE